MKNKILLSVVMVLMIILIMILSYAEKNDYTIPIEPEKGEEPIKIRLLNEADNTVTEINLEDYIVGVVASEMPASFEKEALKAQAVAARTYAMNKKESRSSLNYDLIIGTKDQAYQDNRALLSKWGINFFSNYLKIREAVKDTQSLVLTYEDKIINAFYFSMSNGYTEESELVFKQDLPYLQSVDSKWDNETLNNYEYTKTFTKNDFCQSLEISCDSITIEKENRSNANRVLEISINGKTLKGTEVRSKLGLRSTDFSINIRENEIDITTKGYGHGVGMSQYGANGMAKDGFSYIEILKHYYKNIEIKKINV